MTYFVLWTLPPAPIRSLGPADRLGLTGLLSGPAEEGGPSS